MRIFETTSPNLRPLLSQRISQLGLKLEGSPVERYVQILYRELERKGLKHFRPRCYLTDEWGCPSGEPIIGIPFYLADADLARLEKEIDDLEDEREIRMYLRHEAGHAFNYAYRLYKTPEWRELFGPFNRPYRDHYRPIPFDRNFVRHIEGWYAQKHPDEDFAETFAVWLTAGLPLAGALPRLAGAAEAPLRPPHRSRRGRHRAPGPPGLDGYHGGGDAHDGGGVLPGQPRRGDAGGRDPGERPARLLHPQGAPTAKHPPGVGDGCGSIG